MPFRMRNAAPAIVATRFADAGRNLQKAHSHLVRFVCFQLEANVHFLLHGGGERVTGGEAELETRSCADDEKRLFLEHGQVNLSRSGSVRQNAPYRRHRPPFLRGCIPVFYFLPPPDILPRIRGVIREARIGNCGPPSLG